MLLGMLGHDALAPAAAHAAAGASGQTTSWFIGIYDYMPMNQLGKLYRINRRIYTYGSTQNTTPNHASE